MPEFLLIALIILLYTLQSLFSRLYTDHYPSDKQHAPSVFAVVCGIVVCIVSYIFGLIDGSDFSFNWVTLLLGIANAAVLYGYDEFIIKASATGSYSILTVFSLGGGIILPAVIKSIIPYTGGSVNLISWLQAVAIVIICISVYMVSYKKANSEEKAKNKSSGRFLLFCTALAICNGLYGSMFDIQDQLTGSGQKQLMVIYTFAGAALIALVRLGISMFRSRKKEFCNPFKLTKLSLLYIILAAVVSALAINILVLLVGVVDLTLLYTFDNAGVMLLSVLAAALLFKEKLSTLNIIGCALMALGLVIMGAYPQIQDFLSGLLA